MVGHSLHSYWRQPPSVNHFTFASSFVPGMCRMFLVRNGAHLERRVQCTLAGWKKEALEMKACGLAWAVVSAPDSRLVCLCCLKCCRCGCGYEPNCRGDKVSSILPWRPIYYQLALYWTDAFCVFTTHQCAYSEFGLDEQKSGKKEWKASTSATSAQG